MAVTAHTSVPVPKSVTAGSGVAVTTDFPVVWLTGTFSATVQFQCSPDGGTTWVNVGSALTAAGYVALPTCEQVRANVTVYASGTPVATLLSRRI